MNYRQELQKLAQKKMAQKTMDRANIDGYSYLEDAEHFKTKVLRYGAKAQKIAQNLIEMDFSEIKRCMDSNIYNIEMVKDILFICNTTIKGYNTNIDAIMGVRVEHKRIA